MHLLCYLWASPAGVAFQGSVSKFRKRNKIWPLHVHVLPKTRNKAFSRRFCAQTAKKYTNKTARAKLLKSLMFPAKQEEVKSFDLLT